ncbi:MAG: hypothetical protein AAFP19_12385 [Bacteroidota bacterium]
MQQSKLVRLLKSLQEKEFKQLGKFLQSPFFNTRQELVRLYDYLVEHQTYPQFDQDIMDRERVFAHLYPDDKSFKSKKFRDTLSDLSLLVEEYIIQLELKYQNLPRQKLLIQALGRRNVYAYFVRYTNSLITSLKEKPIRDMHYYKDMLFLNQELFYHPNTPKLKPAVESIEAAMENLDNFYAMAKLRFGCELLNRQNTLSEETPILLFDAVQRMTEAKLVVDNPIFNIYLLIIRLRMEDHEEAVYQALKQLTFEHLDRIRDEEQRIILHYLLNHVQHLINNGYPEYLKESLELYQLGFQYKILIKNDRITYATFTNIAVIASALKELDWLHHFIAHYQPYLDATIRDEAIRISKAYFHFNKGEFQQVTDYLRDCSPLNRLQNCRVRSLTIRALYELYQQEESWQELLLSRIESFDQFLKRERELARQRIMAYKTFISFTRKLISYRNKGNRSTIHKTKLREQLDAKENIIVKIWFVEKIDEL